MKRKLRFWTPRQQDAELEREYRAWQRLFKRKRHRKHR